MKQMEVTNFAKRENSISVTSVKTYRTEMACYKLSHLDLHWLQWYMFYSAGLKGLKLEHVRKIPLDVCSRRRLRLTCAFALSDQNFPCAHFR